MVTWEGHTIAMTRYTDWKFMRAGAHSKAKGLLRYLAYEEDRYKHYPRATGPERWIDCGLGRGWSEILRNASELQTEKVLLRSLVIRPPEDLVAQLEAVDPRLWSNRLELMKEAVDRVMDAEMERVGIQRPSGSLQPLDLPYSQTIHACEDKCGVESPHAHLIVPATDHDRERPFNGYPKDIHDTREVAQRETERLFQLERVRNRPLEQDRDSPERTSDQQSGKDSHPSFGGWIETGISVECNGTPRALDLSSGRLSGAAP